MSDPVAELAAAKVANLAEMYAHTADTVESILKTVADLEEEMTAAVLGVQVVLLREHAGQLQVLAVELRELAVYDRREAGVQPAG